VPSGDREPPLRVGNSLRGTWERDRETEWPSGSGSFSVSKLQITQNSITITGGISIFENFTRDTVLEAYTEENMLFIKDRGEWQEPFTFRRWQAGTVTPREELITISDGILELTFKRIDTEL